MASLSCGQFQLIQCTFGLFKFHNLLFELFRCLLIFILPVRFSQIVPDIINSKLIGINFHFAILSAQTG